MEQIHRQRVTVETVRHKPVGVIITTETFINGKLFSFSETPTVPVHPVESLEVAHDMALAEKPFQDSALEHKAAARAIGRIVFNPERRQLKEWHRRQQGFDKLNAEMASAQVRQHYADQSDELEGQLYRAIRTPNK